MVVLWQEELFVYITVGSILRLAHMMVYLRVERVLNGRSDCAAKFNALIVFDIGSTDCAVGSMCDNVSQ